MWIGLIILYIIMNFSKLLDIQAAQQKSESDKLSKQQSDLNSSDVSSVYEFDSPEYNKRMTLYCEAKEGEKVVDDSILEYNEYQRLEAMIKREKESSNDSYDILTPRNAELSFKSIYRKKGDLKFGNVVN